MSVKMARPLHFCNLSPAGRLVRTSTRPKSGPALAKTNANVSPGWVALALSTRLALAASARSSEQIQKWPGILILGQTCGDVTKTAAAFFGVWRSAFYGVGSAGTQARCALRLRHPTASRDGLPQRSHRRADRRIVVVDAAVGGRHQR